MGGVLRRSKETRALMHEMGRSRDLRIVWEDMLRVVGDGPTGGRTRVDVGAITWMEEMGKLVDDVGDRSTTQGFTEEGTGAEADASRGRGSG
jgi:hypothetical protein